MTQGGQSILRAITKQASNDTGGQKVGPIKIKSMNALLAGGGVGGKKTHTHVPGLSFSFSLKIPAIYISRRDVIRAGKYTLSTYFNQFPRSWISQVTC